MANTNAAFGFRPYRHRGGGEVRTTKYTIASAYNQSIYTGQPVELTGTGQNIQRAAAGNTDNLGVFMGCKYTPSAGATVGKPTWSAYWPASTAATDIEAYVVDDPMVTFLVQCDTLLEGDVAALADWSGTSGSALNGLSSIVLEVSGATSTTGESMRILGLAPEQDNAYGQYAKAEVVFAEHVFLTAANGAGGV
jgi:hypothetical protein